MNIAIKGGFARSCKLQVRRAGRLRISHAIGASAFAPAPCREQRLPGLIRKLPQPSLAFGAPSKGWA